eukprot:285311-Hanusia_phi.AAC.1
MPVTPGPGVRPGLPTRSDRTLRALRPRRPGGAAQSAQAGPRGGSAAGPTLRVSLGQPGLSPESDH